MQPRILPKPLRRALRRRRKERDFAARLATADERRLPDFIIIGAMKAGTTSAFHHLAQHPQIHPALKKEVFFFDREFERGEAWYRAHFPLESEMRPGDITGEATPDYLFDPRAAERIHRVVPRAKLIALLRNPADRAISHWFHESRRDHEDLPLLEALKAEAERLREPLRRGDRMNHALLYQSYQAKGLYLDQLERYWKLFPREQMLILASEDFLRDPEATLKTMFGFLGVDDTFVPPDLTPQNVSKNRADVDPEVRAHLDRLFDPLNEKLFQRLGQRFDW